MRTRLCLILLALFLSVSLGCSRGKGGPPPAPPTTPTLPETKPVEPEVKPEPEPEPEPAPGEVVRLTLPNDGGAWPWTVGPAPEQKDSQPITLNGVGPYAPNGFAVRPEVNRAVVSMRVDPAAGGKRVDPRKITEQTRVTLYDTATGLPIPESSWIIPGGFTVLDLSPDGRSILATASQSGRERGMLRLWVIGNSGQLKRWRCQAHTLPREGLRADSRVAYSTEVRWAGFVGERVVSVSRGGQLRLFDAEGLKPLAGIDAMPCRPAVTPDGTRIAFLVGPLVAFLDPSARKITGARWIGLPPPQPVLRFSPDGSRLAIGGTGRAVILDLASGHFQTFNLPRLDVNDSGVFDKPFGWAGSRYLLADGLLFDPQLPQPVWEYTSAEVVRFCGPRVWATVRAQGSPVATLRSLDLPGPAVEGAIKSAKAKSGVFALSPGGGVKIDVGGVPQDRRGETQQALERRLREIGLTPDPKAAATLFASVDHPGTKPTVIYTGFGSYSYTKTPARLRLVVGGKELWNEAWAVEPPFTVDAPKGTELAEYMSKLSIGHADYKAFALAPLPAHFPGPNAPTGPLGRIDLAIHAPAR